jgi:hypothetical protein
VAVLDADRINLIDFTAKTVVADVADLISEISLETLATADETTLSV